MFVTCIFGSGLNNDVLMFKFIALLSVSTSKYYPYQPRSQGLSHGREQCDGDEIELDPFIL